MRTYKYRKHSTRDFGFVEYKGRRIRFKGPHDSPESRAEYHNWCSAMHGDAVAAVPLMVAAGVAIDVATLCALYLEFADTHYKARKLDSEFRKMSVVASLWIEFAAITPAAAFLGKELKQFQKYLANRDRTSPLWRKDGGDVKTKTRGTLCRNYVNGITNNVRRIVRWAVSEGRLPPTQLLILEAVQPLKPGEHGVRESEKRKPAVEKQAAAILNFVSPQIADMLRVQWHTNVRPDSLCEARGDQFDCSRKTWLWRPIHKMENKGVEVVIPVGPKCREILKPYIQASKGGRLFSPRRNGKSGLYRDFYDAGTYRQSILRGITRLNKLLPADKQIERWTPYQLRHGKTDTVAERFGEEAAQAHNAHKSLDTTQLYRHKRQRLAVKVAETIG